MTTIVWFLFIVSLCLFFYAPTTHMKYMDTYHMVSKTMEVAFHTASVTVLYSMITLMMYSVYDAVSRDVPVKLFMDYVILGILYILMTMTCFYLIETCKNIILFHYKKRCEK